MTRRTALVAVLVLLLATGIACLAPEKPQDDRPLRVAVLAPLTGPAASGGDNSRKGFEMALKELRADGADLSLEYLDTQGSPKVAVSVYQQLMTRPNPPDVIIPQMSGVTQALKPLLTGQHITVATGTANAELSDPSANTRLFRVFLSADSVGAKAAEALVGSAATKVAIACVDDDYGRVITESLKAQFTTVVGNTVVEASYGLMEKDFRTSWARVLKETPDAVFICGYGPGYLTVLNQLRETDYQGLIMTDWSLTDPGYLKATAGVRDGTKVVTVGWQAKFEEDFRRQYGQDGSFVVAGYSHATLELIWAAYSTSDGSPEAMADTLLKIKGFESVMGPIDILPNGGIKASCTVLKVQNMALVPAE